MHCNNWLWLLLLAILGLILTVFFYESQYNFLRPGAPWWVWLIGAISVILFIVAVVLYLRYLGYCGHRKEVLIIKENPAMVGQAVVSAPRISSAPRLSPVRVSPVRV